MNMDTKHQKPNSFYDTFERKGAGQKVHHYCPGCGHGNVHKLIAEAIDDFDIQNRAIFVSPVGCSVFGYYYMDVGNVQAAHGRAPAVGTAINRVHPESIIISYQGDGDLAGIGMGAIVHAANRGESMAVFFVNNAIYGMTGGQMAPTTLLNQKTTTTPYGRSSELDGNPVRMCELMSTIEAPVFIERVSLGTPGRLRKARKAIRKALQLQLDRRGFAFVEILSPCPVNWKMSAVEARKWLIDNLEPAFPVKNFRDVEAPPPKPKPPPILQGDDLLKALDIPKKAVRKMKATHQIEEQNIKIAGFGGQGIMSGGVLLANCGMQEGLNTSWLPSYGPEMRGGTAYASVILSNDIIGAPIVGNPNVLIAMNGPSLDKFEKDVEPGGIIFVNSSLISKKVTRKDVQAYYVPATELANEVGLTATALVIILSIYAKATGAINLETMRQVIPRSLKKKELANINLAAMDCGQEYLKENPV
jgi:2-oxoisovalerate ferredoxin oxidoreductase beta subunit